MPRIRPIGDVKAVFVLKANGHTDREVSALTGVPVNTIRTWRNHGLSQHAERALRPGTRCPVCEADVHEFSRLPRDVYAYLLGVYLGDGCLGHSGNSWSLRIALDEAYPGIVESCCDAIETLRGDIVPRPGPILAASDASSWPPLGASGLVCFPSTAQAVSIIARSSSSTGNARS